MINPFKTNTMQTYLLPEELENLKAIRSTFINDKEFSSFRAWLKKNKKELTSDDQQNRSATWDVIYEHYTKNILYHPGHEGLTERLRGSTHQANANSVIMDVLKRVTPELYDQWEYVSSLKLNELKSFLRIRLDDILRKSGYVEFKFDYAGFVLDPKHDLTQYGIENLDSNIKNQADNIFGVFDQVFGNLIKPLNADERKIMQENFPYLLNMYFQNMATDTTGREYRERLNYVTSRRNG